MSIFEGKEFDVRISIVISCPFCKQIATVGNIVDTGEPVVMHNQDCTEFRNLELPDYLAAVRHAIEGTLN